MDLLRTFPGTLGFIAGATFGWLSAMNVVRGNPYYLPLVLALIVISLVLEVRAHNRKNQEGE